MKLTPALAEKVAILAETSDDLLPLFPPMERAIISALKGIMRSERNSSMVFGQRGA